MKKYLRPVVGVAAFVIGGLVARDQANNVLDILSKTTEDAKKTLAKVKK